MGGSAENRPWKMGLFFLTLQMRCFSLSCSKYALSSALLLIEPLLENKRFANEWFSRSIRSFSLRRMEMFRLFGFDELSLGIWLILRVCYSMLASCPALVCCLSEVIVLGFRGLGAPTDDHLPWLMSTSLFSKI